jgi:hypothetical protein
MLDIVTMSGTGDSQHSIGEWRDETVYAAWKNSTGHCDECPNRQFRDGCHPQFGAGDGDADIMIVGHAPGKGSGGQRQATTQADDPTYTPPETYEEFEYTAAQLDA